MLHTQLSLPHQYGRFLVSGALVFGLVFWGTSPFLICSHDALLHFLAMRLILKPSIHQPFPNWLQSVEVTYLPFFFRQRPLLVCYMIATALAWLGAFLHDTKILRKENKL